MAAIKAGRYEGSLLFASVGKVPVALQQISVYTVGTTTLSTLYTDHIAGTAAANPVITDQMGNYSFFAAPGDYDIVFQVGTVDIRHTITVRDDPQNSPFSQTATTVANKITFGAGVPAIAGIIGDVFIRTDDVGTHALYQCSVAGGSGVATWVALVN